MSNTQQTDLSPGDLVFIDFEDFVSVVLGFACEDDVIQSLGGDSRVSAISGIMEGDPVLLEPTGRITIQWSSDCVDMLTEMAERKLDDEWDPE